MPEVIGIFLRSADNAYQRQLRAMALSEAQRQGFGLLIQSVQFDASQQVEQIREAINNRVANHLVGILVSGVRDQELVPVAHEAAEAGLEWGVLNDAEFVDEIHQGHPERAVFAVSADQTEIGRVQAQYVRALCGDRGRILCVTGNLRNLEAHLRLAGLKEGLGEDFEIIVINADWTSERARMELDRWASGVANLADMPTAYVAQNDEMALGVRQALRDLGSRRDWPAATAPIVGCDGAPDFGQRLVREGRLKATVVMTPSSSTAIKWMARVRHGGERPPVHIILPVTAFPPVSKVK